MPDLDPTNVANTAIGAVEKNAANPQWILNTMMFIVFAGGVSYFGYRAIWIDKPQAEANIQAVNASMAAIQSNAESNRKMGAAIEKMSASVEDINQTFRRNVDTMHDTVTEWKSIENRQDESVRELINRLDKKPSS